MTWRLRKGATSNPMRSLAFANGALAYRNHRHSASSHCHNASPQQAPGGPAELVVIDMSGGAIGLEQVRLVVRVGGFIRRVFVETGVC